MLKFIIMSDLHLVEKGEVSEGLDTFMRLEQAIEAINTRYVDAEFCLLAGDLADLGFLGQVEPYHRLKEVLPTLQIPYHATIGNHDKRELYLSVFGSEERAETGYVDKVIDAKGYRVIMLDSVPSDPGPEIHHGEIAPEQLSWLRDRLEEHSGPVIVVLHHHAAPLYTGVDGIILKNGTDLVDVLKSHDDVRQVIAGHVHYSSTTLWHGIPFTTLAGNHFGASLNFKGIKARRYWGPAQMAVVFADDAQTLVHFDNFLDCNPILR